MAITHVLIVESEPTMAAKLTKLLERTEGFCVETAVSVREVLKDSYSLKPDFIVIDLNTDFFSGFELTEVLHSRRSAEARPVLMLRRRHQDDSDDPQQAAIDSALVRRKLNVLFSAQRSHPQVWELARYRDDHLSADFYAGRYRVDGRSVELTPREQALLRMVVERLEQVVPRAEILERLWGYETRSLDVYILRLRTKLGIRIETLPGFGYRFSPKGAAQLSPAAGASRSEDADPVLRKSATVGSESRV